MYIYFGKYFGGNKYWLIGLENIHGIILILKAKQGERALVTIISAKELALLTFSKDPSDMEIIDDQWHTKVSYSQIDDKSVTQNTKFLMDQHCTDHHCITNGTRSWKEERNMMWFVSISKYSVWRYV